MERLFAQPGAGQLHCAFRIRLNISVKLDFDPGWAIVSLDMWRDTVDMKIPVHDDFKVHFMQQRMPILTNLKAVVGGWKSVLNKCKPAAEDEAEFQELMQKSPTS